MSKGKKVALFCLALIGVFCAYAALYYGVHNEWASAVLMLILGFTFSACSLSEYIKETIRENS